MLDHVYYINLKKSKDRRERIEHEIKKANLKKATRIDALYGPTLSESQYKEWTTQTCASFCNRRLIGCALSHIQAWQTFLESEHNTVLILEDDAVINSTDLNADLKSAPKDFDVLMLGSFVNMNTVALSLAMLGYIKRPKHVRDNLYIPGLVLGLHGYVITRKAAQRMVQYFQQEKVFQHIDLQLNILFDRDQFKVYAYNPPLITQQTSLRESNISQYQFPVILNYVLDHIENKDHQTLGYQMNVSIYETTPKHAALSLQLNAWLAVSLALGLLIKKFKVNINGVAIAYLVLVIIEYMLTRSTKIIVPATAFYLLLVTPSLVWK